MKNHSLLSQLLAMSFDAVTSPTIVLASGENERAEVEDVPTGWGFAWYPGDDRGAAVIKDPIRTGPTAMSQLLHDWERFRGTQFVCHIRGAAKRSSQQDTQPFSRSYAGRDWILAHNGDLDRNIKRDLPLGANPYFEPVGNTDSEHAFCWLLGEIRRRGARSLAEISWEELHGLLREIDAHGTANLVIADGHDVIAYRDQEGFNELHYVRRTPPHARDKIGNEHLELRLTHALDENRSMVLVSSTPMTDDAWIALQPGQMMVARRAAVTWVSALPSSPTVFAPIAAAPAPAERPAVTPPLQSDANAGNVNTNANAANANAAMAALVSDGMLGSTAIASSSHPNLNLQQQVSVSQTTQRAAASPATSRVVRVHHETRYTYDNPVERSSHLFRLRPTHDLGQEVLDYEFAMTPNRVSRSFEDVFGNQTKPVELDQPYSELSILATSRVRVFAPLPLSSPTRRTTIPLVWMPWQRQMMLPYLLPPELPETQLRELSEFAMSFVERQDYNLVNTLVDLNESIYRDFTYESGSTTLETTPFDVYVQRRGVCQDFANLFICLARLMGVPARYRVGYIYTGGNYENKIQSDASHAWAEVYLPWMGWRGFDPTNGVVAGLDHVRVACGRNYRDAAPTSGTIYKGGGTETLSVKVRVEVDDD